MLAEQATFERYTEKAEQYIRDHHSGTDGYIAFCHRTRTGRWSQKFVRFNQIGQAVGEYMTEDCYFSQNSFWMPTRRVESLRKLSAVYVDIDPYKVGLTAEQAYRKIEAEVIETGLLPTPNRIVFSGRGLYTIWWLEPVPGKPLVGLWQVVTDHFYDVLKPYGADPAAKDAARVLRIPGSINKKNGARASVEKRHDYRYELRELVKYLPEKVETTKFRPKKGPAKRTVKVSTLVNLHNLYYTRLQDLLTLCESRGWQMSSKQPGQGKRELVLFLYRYWTLCFCTDKEKALDDALALNQRFDIPLRKNEVITATQSAERAWEDSQDEAKNAEARKKGYPGAGYNYSNKSLITLLDITPEEQRQLSTIIDKDVKQNRRQEARRKAGVKSRDIYLDEQKERSQSKLEALKEAIKKNPIATRKELAEIVGVSVPYVAKLRKML